jgi:hypothetical protein
MKKILLNTKEIESCWEAKDVCFVKMNSGRVWVCNLYNINKNKKERTYNFIKSASNEEIIEIALATKEGN